MILGEIRPHFYCKLNLARANLLNEGINPEWRRVFCVDAVIHDKEFAIRWLYRYCLHCFKISHIDTLVEIAVI